MRTVLVAVLVLGGPALAACGDPGDGQGNENEVITTVSLIFVTATGGDDQTFTFDDPDGDGGEEPVVDAIEIDPGDYAVSVTFENGLEEPPEDITEEVVDEGSEHQVFFTGSAVRGPASDESGAPLEHAYADEDSSGLPIGVENSVTAESGSGDLVITLRHMPPVGDSATKTADTAMAVRDGGFPAISGTTDAQVTFAVTVR